MRVLQEILFRVELEHAARPTDKTLDISQVNVALKFLQALVSSAELDFVLGHWINESMDQIPKVHKELGRVEYVGSMEAFAVMLL